MMSELLARLSSFINQKTRLNVYFELAKNGAKMPYAVYSVISQNAQIGINGKNHTKQVLIQIDLYTKDLKSNLYYSELLEYDFCEFYIKPFSISTQGPSKDDEHYRTIIEAEFVL